VSSVTRAVVGKLARSAYGLDAYREADWRPSGACASGEWNPDWWTTDDTAWTRRRWAMWVCINECPVRQQCGQWAQEHTDLVDRAVYGGMWWTRTRDDTGRRYGPVRPSRYATPEKPPAGARTFGVRQTKPCGTRAGAQRHRERGEPRDDACAQAERKYDRDRKREECVP
jgi:hypothetical protein